MWKLLRRTVRGKVYQMAENAACHMLKVFITARSLATRGAQKKHMYTGRVLQHVCHHCWGPESQTGAGEHLLRICS